MGDCPRRERCSPRGVCVREGVAGTTSSALDIQEEERVASLDNARNAVITIIAQDRGFASQENAPSALSTQIVQGRGFANQRSAQSAVSTPTAFGRGLAGLMSVCKIFANALLPLILDNNINKLSIF